MGPLETQVNRRKQAEPFTTHLWGWRITVGEALRKGGRKQKIWKEGCEWLGCPTDLLVTIIVTVNDFLNLCVR